MTYDTGTVSEVSVVTLGSELVADHATGATVLSVGDTSDFSDDGGTLTVADQVHDYVAVDDEAETITLAAATTAAYVEGDRVLLHPLAQEKKAQVMVGDADEAVQAVVPHDLWDRIPDGVRADGAGETVTLALEGDEYVVTDVLGVAPTIDGSFLDPTVQLDPAIVPSSPPPPPDPPTLAPSPEVEGGVASLFVRLTPIGGDASLVYDVFVSTTTPVDVTGDESPHFHGTSAGTFYRIETMPDGTPLRYFEPEPDPLPADYVPVPQTYHVAAVARNVSGSGPASAEMVGSLKQVSTEDVSAQYVYAGTVRAEQIESGTVDAELVLAGVIESIGPAGQRVGLSASKGFYSRGAIPEGGTEDQAPILVSFPVDGKPNIVAGQFSADQFTANNGATLRAASTLEPLATLTLQQGVSAPKAPPSYVIGYEQRDLDAQWLSEERMYGWTQGHDGRWYTATRDYPGTGGRVRAFDANGDLSQTWLPLETSYVPSGGIVYTPANGGRYVMLVHRQTDGRWFMDVYDTAMVRVRRNELTGWSWTHKPIIGYDHMTGRLMTAGWRSYAVAVDYWSLSATDVTSYSYSLSNGSDGEYSTAGLSYAHEMAFVAGGTFDYGVEHVVFRRVAGTGTTGPSGFIVYRADVMDPYRETTAEWPIAVNWDAMDGGWWDGSRFHGIHYARKWYRYESGRAMWGSGVSARWSLSYSNIDTTTVRAISATVSAGSTTITATGGYKFGSGDIDVPVSGTGIPAGARIVSVDVGQATAYLSSPATAAGTSVTLTSTRQETAQSARASFTMTKRARLTVTTEAIPTGFGGVNDPDSIRIYLGVGSTDANTTMVRERTLAPGQTTWTFDSATAAEGGAPDPAFGNSTPAKVDTQAGGWWVNGKGDGSIGTGSFRTSVDARVTANENRRLTEQARVTAVTTNASAEFSITFPQPFTSTPVVTANANRWGGRGITILSRSATGFTGQLWHWSSGLVANAGEDIAWQAVIPST